MLSKLIRRKYLPPLRSCEKGQSFVEFILLMLMVIMLSYGFMRVVNTNLGKTWVKMVNMIIKDTDPEAETVKLQ